MKRPGAGRDQARIFHKGGGVYHYRKDSCIPDKIFTTRRKGSFPRGSSAVDPIPDADGACRNVISWAPFFCLHLSASLAPRPKRDHAVGPRKRPQNGEGRNMARYPSTHRWTLKAEAGEGSKKWGQEDNRGFF